MIRGKCKDCANCGESIMRSDHKVIAWCDKIGKWIGNRNLKRQKPCSYFKDTATPFEHLSGVTD